MAGRRRRKKRYSRKGTVVILGIMVLILGVMYYQNVSLTEKNQIYREQAEELEKQLTEEEERVSAIEDMRKYMQTKQYIEEVAKDKLGLVYPDEIIFKPEDE